jgi:hypothetical protein
MAEKYLTCPKCNCVDLKLSMEAETYLELIQNKGVLLNHTQPEPRLGPVTGLRAYCLNTECNYDWKVRKFHEFAELPNWPDNITAEEVDVIRIAVDGKMVPEVEEVNPIERNVEEMLGIADSGKRKRGRPRKVA